VSVDATRQGAAIKVHAGEDLSKSNQLKQKLMDCRLIQLPKRFHLTDAANLVPHKPPHINFRWRKWRLSREVYAGRVSRYGVRGSHHVGEPMYT